MQGRHSESSVSAVRRLTATRIDEFDNVVVQRTKLTMPVYKMPAFYKLGSSGIQLLDKFNRSFFLHDN